VSFVTNGTNIFEVHSTFSKEMVLIIVTGGAGFIGSNLIQR
jgi:hypothetical protein